MRDTLLDVAQTLRSLFENKSSLVGFNDWDRFVGCVILIEQVAYKIPEAHIPEESEMVDDGR